MHTCANHVVFAALPSIERQIQQVPSTESRQVVIIDLTNVYRIETAVARYLEQQGREFASKPCQVDFILVGFTKGSGVHADLGRGGIICRWIGDSEQCGAHASPPSLTTENSLIAFDSLKEALQWTELPGEGM